MTVFTTKEGSAGVVTEIRRRSPNGRSLRMMLSSAGRRVSLMRSFRQSAEFLGVDLTMFACDLTPEWSPACIEADMAFAAPSAESDEFIPAMLEKCEREGVELIVPTIDTELIAYSEAKDRFAAINCHIAVSDASVVHMARDKLATARFLTAAGIPSPRTASVNEFLANKTDLNLPLLAKPRHGSSSRGIAMVHNRSQIMTIDATEPYILQEFLHGREFTVSLYFDQEGQMKCAVPHERLRVRSGEVEKGVTLRDPMLRDLAYKLGSALKGACGAMCFQARMDDRGNPSIFEINARFGGGYPLVHQAGARFTLWMLEERLGMPHTANDDWQKDVLMLRFDDAVFV
ncbi:MAG: ATP-grasp domain-containing protein [Sphingomonadaceae bacterium]|nr:ATP-grasp domain-containing protein [Sphingomonadaceae bacterium]